MESSDISYYNTNNTNIMNWTRWSSHYQRDSKFINDTELRKSAPSGFVYLYLKKKVFDCDLLLAPPAKLHAF